MAVSKRLLGVIIAANMSVENSLKLIHLFIQNHKRKTVIPEFSNKFFLLQNN